MALHWLTYNRYEHRFDGEGANGLEPFADRRVFVFDPRIERGAETIGDRWRKLDSAIRGADVVILRGSSKDFLERVTGDALLRDRVKNTPLAVLSGSWNPDSRTPTLISPPWAVAPGEPVDLDVLREHELLTLVRESKAINREADCHYQLPSSTVHAEAFIRLADALTDHTDLVRLTDWVLPHLEQGAALLGDNGSLLGLLSTVAGQAHKRFGWADVPVATLDSYPSDPLAVRRFFDGFRARNRHRLLFLVTVSSSGTVAGRVNQATGSRADVIVLCGTDAKGGKSTAACFARQPVERWHTNADGECDACSRLQLLEVDPETYEVRTKLKRKRVGLDIEEAKRMALFWEAADRQGAVELHAEVPTATGDPAGRRHLAVALDVPRLLDDSWFRGECLAALRKQERPDAVLIPANAAAETLADLVVESHEIERKQVLIVPIGELHPEVVETLRRCSTVLIADDVLITAETVRGLRRRVHAACQSSVATWGFVAVMRPPSLFEESRARRPFTSQSEDGGKTFECRLSEGFKLFLAPPGERQCPWCQERDLLAERIDDLSEEAAAIATERLDRLRAIGMKAPLLLDGAGPTRTAGSYFGDLRDVAGFAAASALTQRMKESFQRDRGVQEIRTLDTALVLEALFDPILRAGILRTFDQRDLRDQTSDKETIPALGVYDAGGSLAEDGYAAAQGKLPLEAVRQRLRTSDDKTAVPLLLDLLGG